MTVVLIGVILVGMVLGVMLMVVTVILVAVVLAVVHGGLGGGIFARRFVWEISKKKVIDCKFVFCSNICFH